MISLQTLRDAAADLWWSMTQWMGHPSEIARQGFASRRMSRLMRDWVGNLEKLVRRIVYLAALQMDVPALGPTRTAPRAPRIPPVIPGRRPCLRIMGRRGEPRSGSKGWRRRHDDDPDHQWQPVRIGHYARRLEALRHTIWHTQPHALRLARFLARRAAAKQPLPQVGVWMIPSRLLTGGQGNVDEHMTAIGPLIEDELRKRGAYIDPWEEPG